jgi:hypothetical protein
MPRCSHRKKARPSRKTQSDTRKAGCTRFKSNQVPLIPASRGIITRRLTPASFLVPFPPPFFFSTSCSQVRPTTNNSTALRLFPPLRCAQHCSDLPTERSHLPRLATLFICPVLPVPSSHAPGTGSSAFRTRFPPRSSRRDKGVSDRDRNVAG